jgi:23S rRNA (guanosine2251-2'-O)-methyltransferase
VQLIFGINPLLEALKSRDLRIKKIVIAENRGGDALRKIVNLAKQRGIPLEFRERSTLDRLTHQKNHQGFVGICESFEYVSVDDVIANCSSGLKYNLILILDSIMDPQNLGSLIRTAHCFGANGVIIPENRSAAVTASVMKASAGAAHHLPVAMVVNISQTIEYLKEKDFWIYGADPVSGGHISVYNYENHVCLVMGSEGRGIRPLIKKKCDFLLSIPITGKVDSLNVSVAAGIILYEMLRAWGKV